MTLAWILFVFVRSRITVSGVRDKGSATLVQPLGNVHRKPKTLEATAVTAEFHVTTIPPSWVESADGYCAEVARTVGEPDETETLLPPMPRGMATGTPAESPAIATIVADACVQDDASRRTTRAAGTISSKNRLRPRPMFHAFEGSELRDDT